MMRYAKTVVAVLGAAVATALQLGLTGRAQQVLTIADAVLTALAVYLVPNDPPLIRK